MAQEQPKITLYWLNKSRAQSIVWLLEALNLTYDVRVFRRDDKTMLAPAGLEEVHPLGKSPVVTIESPSGSPPLVLAESGLICQYLCEHFASGGGGDDGDDDDGNRGLMPKRWKDGHQHGAMAVRRETDEWLRWMYYLHYVEGSFMPLVLVTLIVGLLKSPKIPFFIRPITAAVAKRIDALFVFPNAQKHLDFLDSQLSSPPGGGEGGFLCGDRLTAADILMSFPLQLAKERFPDVSPGPGRAWRDGSPLRAYSRVFDYLGRLEATGSYKRAMRRIDEFGADAKKG